MRYLLVVALLFTGCASAPPNRPANVVLAFQATQAIKSLDMLRDFAIDANAQTPPMLSTATTRLIVTYHRSAIRVVHDVPAGWKTTVQTGIIELFNSLPEAEQQKIGPYVTLIEALVMGAIQ